LLIIKLMKHFHSNNSSTVQMESVNSEFPFYETRVRTVPTFETRHLKQALMTKQLKTKDRNLDLLDGLETASPSLNLEDCQRRANQLKDIQELNKWRSSMKKTIPVDDKMNLKRVNNTPSCFEGNSKKVRFRPEDSVYTVSLNGIYEDQDSSSNHSENIQYQKVRIQNACYKIY